MALARVWNDNVYPHTEKFKEQEITIPPKSFIEMDYHEAKEFRSQFTAIKTDGERNPLPQSFKMIRVEKLGTDEAVNLPLVCHATGKLAASEAELAKMNAEHIGNLEEKSKETLETTARLQKEIDDLKAALAERVAAEKRGPGRPKKEG
jgi:hypothetical protein